MYTFLKASCFVAFTTFPSLVYSALSSFGHLCYRYIDRTSFSYFLPNTVFFFFFSFLSDISKGPILISLDENRKQRML